MSENQTQQAQENAQQAQENAQESAQRQTEIQTAPQQAQENGNAYQTIIEQQQAQIDALLAQTANLNQQIIDMVKNGAQFNDAQQAKPVPQTQPVQNLNTPSLATGEDYSLEALAKEIGKHE